MKNTRINCFLGLVLLCALFAKMQFAIAAQSFQNNLLKMDFYKSSLGGIKLTLYTNKPYSDAIVTNKKSDSEYVILLPETSNSLTVQPSLSAVSDVVRSVNIKTQQYENQLKGYTKITIVVVKPVEIAAEAQVLSPSTYKVSESDYKELLAQTTKKKTTETKKETKPALRPSVPAVKKETVKTVKTTVLTPVAKTKTVKTEKISQKTEKALPAKSVSVVKKSEKVVSKAEVKKEEVKVSKPQGVKEAKPVIKQQIEKSKQVSANNVQKVETKPEVKPVIAPKEVKVEQSKVEPIKTEKAIKQTPKEIRVKEKIKKYLEIIKNNIYTTLGFALAGFIILLLFVRKNAANYRKQKEIFESHLKEQPTQVTDYSENISEDMTWNEKFQTYVDNVKTQSTELEGAEPTVEHEGLDELFMGDASETIIGENLPEEFIEPAAEIQSESGLYEEPVFEEEEFKTEEIEQDEFESEEIIPEKLAEEPYEESMMEETYLSPEEESFVSDENLDELFGEEVSLTEESYLEEVPEQGISSQEISEYELSEYEPTDAVAEIEEVSQPYEYTELGYEQPEESQDEFIKAEYSIDDEKGLYLVDFENTTALVGHINDEIFVLKRFEEKILGPIKVRLDEQAGSKSSYMTRVGKFRGLVEVTPEQMKLLIEL